MTWLVWAIAAAATVELLASPLVVLIVIGIAAVTVEACGTEGPLRRAFPLLVGLGVAFGGLRALITVLTTHGVGRALVTLPHTQLPRGLGGFTVGGTIEGEVLSQALSDALVIVGVMAVFGAFNAVVSHHELVQAAPRAFSEVGLVITVALAFVPSTITTLHQVREADRARTGGAVVRRGRLLRTAVPVLEVGLERAIALAESMDARGAGHQPPSPGAQRGAWLGLASLLVLGGSFVALASGASELAAAVSMVAAAGLAGAIALSSRSSHRTRYRPRAAATGDWAVGAAALATPLALLGLRLGGDQSLVWTPTALDLPTVSIAALVALAGLAAPAAAKARPG